MAGFRDLRHCSHKGFVGHAADNLGVEASDGGGQVPQLVELGPDLEQGDARPDGLRA